MWELTNPPLLAVYKLTDQPFMALRNYILIPVGLPNRYFLPGTKATLSYKIIQPLKIWELIFITPSCTYTKSVRTLNFNIIISKLKYMHFLTTQINFKKFYPEVFIYSPLTIIWGFDNFSTCFFIYPDKFQNIPPTCIYI